MSDPLLSPAAPLTVSFAEACRAVGIGQTMARKAERENQLPFRVIRVGRALRVPRIDLERLLLDRTGGLDLSGF